MVVLALWGSLVAAYVWGPSPVLLGVLPGPDDYMRMVQVFDWLDGAAWTDLSQRRLDPPGGVVMHWSRLADLPLALVVWSAEPWVGREQAAIWAAVAVPSLQLLCLMLITGWAARPLLGHRRLVAAPVMTVLTVPLLVQFFPGRVDHHGWQLLFAAVILGALVRLIRDPDGHGPAFAAALAAGLGLWVGPEVLAWIALFQAMLCGAWIVRGGSGVDAGVKHAATLFMITVALLLATRDADVWWVRACDGFTVTYVGIAGLVLAFWCGVWLLARRRASGFGRLAAAVLAGGLGGTAALVFFPECLDGPYAALDPQVVDAWVANIGIVRSAFLSAMNAPLEAPFWLAGPLVGIAAALVQVMRNWDEERLAWAAVLVFTAAAFGLAGWESRFLPFAHLFAVLPLAWMLSVPWEWTERFSAGPRLAGRIGLLVLFGPVPGALIMAAGGGLGGGAEAIAVRSVQQQPEACDLRVVVRALPGTSGGQRLIAGFIDMGSELLYRTPHAVLAAPYHRNSRGLLDLVNLFSAAADGAARNIISRRGVDYVLICASSRSIYVYGGGGQDTFVGRLAAGQIPSWLIPVPLGGNTDLRLFEVSGR